MLSRGAVPGLTGMLKSFCQRLCARLWLVVAVLPVVLTPASAGSGGPLPSHLSPLVLFMSADGIVKGVICILLLASVATWTVLVAKTIDLHHALRHTRRACDVLDRARSLAAAGADIRGAMGGAARLVDVALTEMRQSVGLYDDREGVKERIALRLERVEAAAGRQMFKGVGVLATIGATAPFVGLFGTVWGIMNSFLGIADAQTSSLSVVAPGIAEALLATAVGLVAAIPAVIIYNLFVRCISSYKGQLADCAAAVMRLASRDLSVMPVRGEAPLRAVAE